MAWEIVEPLFKKDKDVAEERYKQYRGQRNNLYANSLEEIIPAAYSGQIDALFIQDGFQQWGKYNINKNKVEFHDQPKDGDEDLLEYVSLLTLSRGGKVFPVSSDELPDKDTIAAAVLRF